MASASKPLIPNVLADRYASAEMAGLWTDEARVLRERDFWITVLTEQIARGYQAPKGALEAYQKAKDHVDLASIRERERRTGHDVMARIEEFNALAGFESIHVGMTSRDVTENTEQAAILASLALTRTHALATLARLDALAVHYRDQPVVGRSHNVPAQITTLGKRFATAGEELMLGLAALDQFIESYPLRGIKGPMGTAADQSQLLSSADAAASLDAAIAEALGADLFTSVGQVYPRSLDLATVDLLIRLMSPLASLAATIRLMAGTAQASEGFAKGRVGSSAMPHKMNASRSERIHGLYAALGGSHAQLAAVTGNQWYEGDVTCSVVRRVALPNAFFAADGLLQTALAVLGGFEAYPAVITAEIKTYLPFLATTKILLAAVAKGVGRDTAHAIIKEHAVAAATNMRETGAANDLITRLAGDDRIKLSAAELEELLAADPLDFTGRAREQVDAFHNQVTSELAKDGSAARYDGEAVL